MMAETRRTLMLGGLAALAGLLLAASASRADVDSFTAALSGAQMVPPVVDTRGRGEARFSLTPDGRTLEHELVVNNIKDIVQAHVHCSDLGDNGPVGVTLYNGPAVTISGILTKGPLGDPESDTACYWDDLGDVVAAMRNGEAYVDVHTLTHLPGEIRGNIR